MFIQRRRERAAGLDPITSPKLKLHINFHSWLLQSNFNSAFSGAEIISGTDLIR